MLNSAVDSSRVDLWKPLSGGPEFWVARSGGADLGLRADPALQSDVTLHIKDGAHLSNEGCKQLAAAVWCQVASPETPGSMGWIEGRFLTAPGGAGAEAAFEQVSGDLACSSDAGETEMRCRYRVDRAGNGNASLWVTSASGDERYIEFLAGTPSVSGMGADVSIQRAADLYVIEFGEGERYEIPLGVVDGG
jgi:hypothetical protein